ncbi:MAG: hypothetical protein AABZ47_12605 [Planctomycetota bacterium]
MTILVILRIHDDANRTLKRTCYKVGHERPKDDESTNQQDAQKVSTYGTHEVEAENRPIR